MVTCVNLEYCKKLLVSLPGQSFPTQYHEKKDETFLVQNGQYIITLNGKKQIFNPGDVITVKPGVTHGFTTKNGGILEEISSTHFPTDSFYLDKKIALNKNRKTLVSHWRNIG